MKKNQRNLCKAKFFVDFYYPHSFPEHDQYKKFIISEKKKYKANLIELKKKRDDLLLCFSREKLIELIDSQREIVDQIVLSIIKNFQPVLEDINFSIFWTGGFSRGSNRLGGDYDLSFVYNDSERSKMAPIEELICATLASILGVPRDYVHYALTLEKIDENLPALIEVGKLAFRTHWTSSNPKVVESHPISPRLESLMLRLDDASRSPETLERRMTERTNPEICTDWSSSYRAIFNGNLVETTYNNVTQKEMSFAKEPDAAQKFNALIDETRRQNKNLLESMSSLDLKKVSVIKKLYKKAAFAQFFLVLSLIRRRLMIEGVNLGPVEINNYSKKSQIKKLLGGELFKALFDQIYLYIWATVRLEAMFEKKQIRFGSHSVENIKKSFDRFYQKNCPDVGEDFRQFHNDLLYKTLAVLDKALVKIKIETNKENNSRYDFKKEYINIHEYSPFWYLNEVSPEYQYSKFDLPFVLFDREVRPVHPDTFYDLGLKSDQIVQTKKVFPTSSFRTLYEPKEHICYKVPILRRITRGLRDLPNNELNRSIKAAKLLGHYHFPGFQYLTEECHFAADPTYNFIRRTMPEEECFPWFYVISSQKFDAEYELRTAKNIIKSWMFFASKGIYLEYHTQNILVDRNSNIYYRDLSDIRSIKEKILRPSYAVEFFSEQDVMATIFDRTVCKQNLHHLFRYSKKLGNKEMDTIKTIIKEKIDEYGLDFPDYSFDFPANQAVRIPQKENLTVWRTFA